MKITIDEDICLREGLTFAQVLFLLLMKTNEDKEQLYEDLIKKEVIVQQQTFSSTTSMITQRWDDVLSTILLDSESNKDVNSSIDDLTENLMQIFPQGKKEGTNVYWRGNRKDIKLRLKKFFKLYGTNYTYEQILNAARKYVNSFNGNYSYMRVLKYFIWKDEKKLNAEGNIYIDETSELASLIENEGQKDVNNDWSTQLI